MGVILVQTTMSVQTEMGGCGSAEKGGLTEDEARLGEPLSDKSNGGGEGTLKEPEQNSALGCQGSVGLSFGCY
jgi:hypothetical protein